ncbi:hypothetical protein [Staphylococcus ratti]|uniref:Uncharacterized protein n=1 Tax=Staphylococcus ratti TaxID=2892440 RepID=A0ABY3PDD9_9STAP|nr:hypothetical protein [Staphylococcus ratti]UEX90341.1 hypothetical protein LN051_01335 [Staphylococcus ratti]
MKKRIQLSFLIMLVVVITLGFTVPRTADAVSDSTKAAKTYTTDVKDTTKLSQTQKAALAYYIQGYDRFTFTRQEIKKGKYTVLWMEGKKYVYPIKKIDLVKQPRFSKGMEHMQGAPEDMVFYHVLPAKGNFATVIGVSKTQVVIGGTQNSSTYKAFLKNAKVQTLAPLYQQYHKDPMYQQIVNKMVVRTTYPKS